MQDYRTEVNFFEGASIISSVNLDDDQKTHTKLMHQLVDILPPDFGITEAEKNLYIGELLRVDLLHFKNPAALFLGWLAQGDNYKFVATKLAAFKSWPPNIDPVSKIDLIRYAEFWRQIKSRDFRPQL